MDGATHALGRAPFDCLPEGASATGETGLHRLPLLASARVGGQHYRLAVVLPVSSKATSLVGSIGRILARPTGFEPATCSFGGCHSIHLSYGRTAVILQEIPES